MLLASLTATNHYPHLRTSIQNQQLPSTNQKKHPKPPQLAKPNYPKLLPNQLLYFYILVQLGGVGRSCHTDIMASQISTKLAYLN